MLRPVIIDLLRGSGFMNEELIPLHWLLPGRCGRVSQINISGMARRRMLDLGLTFHTKVAALQKSPAGDPTAYFIRGAVIALRSQDASQILITPLKVDREECWYSEPNWAIRMRRFSRRRCP